MWHFKPAHAASSNAAHRAVGPSSASFLTCMSTVSTLKRTFLYRPDKKHPSYWYENLLKQPHPQRELLHGERNDRMTFLNEPQRRPC